jgi:hypothetical protein
MDYEAFLSARRLRMAEIIRIAFRKLGGEPDAPPLAPPWFLPGAELVWKRIAEAELSLRAVVRVEYAKQFGDRAGEAIAAALDVREREILSRASRNRPVGADPLGLVDYLYIGQLPGLLFNSGVWPEARHRFGSDLNAKGKLQLAIDQIVPVRNEIAHLREVPQERLQRASLACIDLIAMIGQAT